MLQDRAPRTRLPVGGAVAACTRRARLCNKTPGEVLHFPIGRWRNSPTPKPTASPTRPRRHQGFSPGWRRGPARSERSSTKVLGLDDLDRSGAGSPARVDAAGARQGGAGSAFRGRKVPKEDTPGREKPLYSHPGALWFPRSRPKSGVRGLTYRSSVLYHPHPDTPQPAREEAL